MKKYAVTLQASTTVRFNRSVTASSPEEARAQMLVLLKAINSGAVGQAGEFFNQFKDANFEITESPQEDEDFELDDIEVEEE